jgi:hypothetical protein
MTFCDTDKSILICVTVAQLPLCTDRWDTQLMAGLKLKYPPERMFKWVKFWDEQMYKSLEAGYQMGLESLNESLADIKVSVQLLTDRTIHVHSYIRFAATELYCVAHNVSVHGFCVGVNCSGVPSDLSFTACSVLDGNVPTLRLNCSMNAKYTYTAHL